MSWRVAQWVWIANVVIWSAAASLEPVAGLGVGVSIAGVVHCRMRLSAGLRA